MITKRTRALSIIAAFAMIVSMFACFVIPASAETTDEVAVVKAMYADVLANASADADGALAAALEAEYADADTAKTELAAIAGTSITLNEGIKPRYAYNEAYAAAGYGGKDFSISQAIDWTSLVTYSQDKVIDYNLYVTDDIDFAESGTMLPLCFGSSGSPYFKGNLYGQGHTFKNVSISAKSAGGYLAAGLISAVFNNDGACGATTKIDSLGLTGTIENTATGTSYVGVFVGANAKGDSSKETAVAITNCWADVTVKTAGSHGSRAVYTGIVGNPGNTLTIDNCVLTGTFISTGGISVFAGNDIIQNTTSYFVKNSINALNLVSATNVGAAVVVDTNVPAEGKIINTYSVGSPMYKTFGTPTEDQVTDMSAANATHSASSVFEAAYKINANRTDSNYYTVKDGRVVAGTAENQLRKITILRGAQTFDAYAATGTVALADVIPGYKDAEAVTVKDDTLGTTVAVTDGKITMTGDVTVTVTDTAESAKAALEAAEQAGWELKDLNMYNETAAWLAAAEELVAGDDVAAILAKAAELKGLTAYNATLTIKTDAASPYSKKDVYKTLGCTNTTEYSIVTKEDWLAAVIDSNATTSNAFSNTIHFLRDIDFENVEMEPLCYHFQSNVVIDGHDHKLKNINIVGTYTGDATTGALNGIGLVSKANQSITNLHIESGTVNAHIAGGSLAYIGSIAAMRSGGDFYNCSSNATINVTSDAVTAKAYIGGVAGYGAVTCSDITYGGTINADLTKVTSTTSESYFVGGVFGWAQGTPSDLTNEGTINVQVSSTSTVAAVTYTGGVLGANRMPVSDSVNKGVVNVTGNATNVGGVVGYGYGDKGIENCSNEGAITVTGDSYTGGIVGYANTNTIYKCINKGDVTVKGTGDCVGGIVGRGVSAAKVDSCINLGNVTATGGIAQAFYGYGGNAAKVYNSIAAGTAKNAAYRFHANIYDSVSSRPLFNSYAVGMTVLHYNGTPADNYVDGSTIDINGATAQTYTDDTFVKYYQVDSVGEAAWNANKNYDSTLGKDQVFYTLIDGELAFGTSDNQVRRIAITRGSSATYVYAVPGDEVDLYAINPALESAEGLVADNEIGDITETGTFTMVNNDVVVNVTDSLESAKAALVEKIEAAWDAEDLNMYTETQTWLATAKDLVANGDNAETIINHVIDADTVLAGTLTLDTTAYAPYSKIATYTAEGWVDAGKYSINSAEDWIAAGAATLSGKELHVNRDIDFGGVAMAPAFRGNFAFTGSVLDGHGYTFKDINVVGASDTGNYRIGVGLLANATSGSLIKNLGVTGKVTNTLEQTTISNYPVLTAALVAGKNNGTAEIEGYGTYGFVIDNCWTDVHVKGPSGNTYGLGALNAFAQNDNLIQNCINYGTIESTTNGAAGAFIRAIIKNCINEGSFANTSAAAAVLTDNASIVTNTYAVGTSYLYNDNTSTYDNTNEVSAKEAAYKATNGTTYFTVKDGEVAFGTATDRVFKVELTGDYEAVGYYLPGEVCNIYTDLGLTKYDDTTLSGATVDADGNVTMGTADVTITVAYGDSQIGTAKAELKVLIDKYSAIDQNLIDGESTIISWLSAANALYASDEATYSEIRLQIVAAEGVTATMKSGYYVPFGAKDAAYDIVNAGSEYGIYTEADWEALVNAGSVTMNTLHIMNDITFTKSHLPVAYGGGIFTGHVDGHNHVLTICMNFADSDLTSGVGLFSRFAGDHTIKNLGLAGTLDYSISGSAGSKYVGGFIGQTEQRIQFIKCFTTLDITINKAQYGGHFVGGAPTLNTRYDGCFAAGSITATYTDPGGLTGGYTGNAHKMYNSFDATTSDATYMLRIHSGAIDTTTGYDSTRTGNNYAVGKDVFYFNDLSSSELASNAAYTTWAADHKLADDAYATGEVGYLLNQNYVADTGTRVYYAYDSVNDRVIFGNDDGSNQVRKITYSGVTEGTIYVNQGDVVPFADIAGTGAKYYVGAEEITDLNAYTMPANDVVMTVEASYDVEAYNTAYAGLSALKTEYAGYNLDLFENASEMSSLISQFDFYVEDQDPQGVIDLWASYESNVIVPALKDGKYVPYGDKAAYAKVDDGTNYGIYDVDDWNAFVAAGANSGKVVHLMNNLTLSASAPVLGYTAFSGTFNGHDYTLTVAHTANLAPTSESYYGIFGKGGTIQNLTIAGTFNVTMGTEDAYLAARLGVGVFSGGSGTYSALTNEATVTASAFSSMRVWVGGIYGSLGLATNCTNSGAITVTGCSSGEYLAVGGIAGRMNQSNTNTGCLNEGDINVTTLATSGTTNVGGISGTTAGNDIGGCTNIGDITVSGGRWVYVGGIQGSGTDTNDNFITGNLTNSGIITVNAGENPSAVQVGGIFGSMMWPVNDGAVISNSGAITVEAANPYTNAYIGGIAGSMSALATGSFTATNTGAITVGGMDAANENHVADQVVAFANNATVTENANGSLTVCDHADTLVYTHVADTKTHTVDCSECSYLATVDCDGDWTYGAKEDFVVDGTTITSSHTMTCTLCTEANGDPTVYDEVCVGTLVTNPADCTHGTKAVFDHGCGRETVIMVAGCEDHVFTGEFTTEDAADGYEHRKCDCTDCEVYESRLLDITFSTESTKFNPGGDATVTLTLASGKLNAGTFTVTVGEGFTVKSVNGVEGNTITLAEAMNAGDSFDIVVTAGATTYADGEVTITITEAKNAEDGDVTLENVVATIAINVTPGDANGDNTVNLIDAIIALRESAGLNAEGVCNIANADMDGDGNVTADDAVAIVRLWLKTV